MVVDCRGCWAVEALAETGGVRMMRIANALVRINWGKRASAVFALSAMTAMAVPAQTFTTLFRFDDADGYDPEFAGLA